MTKRLKTVFLIIFSALLIVCAAFLLFSKKTYTARAADANTPANDYTEAWALADNNFEFTPGAALFVGSEGFDRMRFSVNMLNADFKNFKNFPFPNDNGFALYWGGVADVYFYYQITLYRGNDFDYSSRALQSYAVLFWSDDTYGNKFNGYVLEKEISVYSESISVSQLTGLNLNVAGDNAVFKKSDCPLNGYTIKYTFTVTGNDGLFSGLDSESLSISISPKSYYSNYFVTFEYGYQYQTFKGIFLTSYGRIKNTISSSARSIYKILYNMNEQGTLEDEITPNKLELANSILTDVLRQNVTINYLTLIPGTPFATSRSAVVNVPVIDNDINIDDVNDYLYSNGLPVIENKCLQSNLYDIVYDPETAVYKTYYLKNVWLRTITTDGNYFDYFLDINNSYFDTYHPFVDNGVMSENLFEYFYSTKILNKFPELTGYRTNEVYGYFGFAVIPNTLTLNTLFAEVLDVDATHSGIINYFNYEDNISYEAHRDILEDYNYSWLSQAWDGLAGFVSGGTWAANYYVFYTDSDDGFIGQGGQDSAEDTDGVIKNEVVEPIVDGISDAISTVWGLFTGITGNFYGIIAIIGIFAVVIALIKHKNKK